MSLSKKQFSIGRLFYYTFFGATIAAMLQAKAIWAGFAYAAAFVAIVSAYVIWRLTRPYEVEENPTEAAGQQQQPDPTDLTNEDVDE